MWLHSLVPQFCLPFGEQLILLGCPGTCPYWLPVDMCWHRHPGSSVGSSDLPQHDHRCWTAHQRRLSVVPNPGRRCFSASCPQRGTRKGSTGPPVNGLILQRTSRAPVTNPSANNEKLTTVVSDPSRLDYKDCPRTWDLDPRLEAPTQRGKHTKQSKRASKVMHRFPRPPLAGYWRESRSRRVLPGYGVKDEHNAYSVTGGPPRSLAPVP